jgi:hypothetical protein
MSRSSPGLARTLALAAVLGCSAPKAREVPVSNTTGAPAAPRADEHDAIVAAVLARFSADPETLPDAGLLPKQGPIYVLSEVGEKPDPVVRIGALPRGPRPFVGRTLAELQAEADKHNVILQFIHFYSITIHGDRASVSSGADILYPTRHRDLKTCCCLSSDEYEKRAGRWTFVSRGSSICS